MLIEMIVPMNSAGGKERDVMEYDALAAGMHHVHKLQTLSTANADIGVGFIATSLV
jgi:hypothetical protein